MLWSRLVEGKKGGLRPRFQGRDPGTCLTRRMLLAPEEKWSYDNTGQRVTLKCYLVSPRAEYSNGCASQNLCSKSLKPSFTVVLILCPFLSPTPWHSWDFLRKHISRSGKGEWIKLNGNSYRSKAVTDTIPSNSFSWFITFPPVPDNNLGCQNCPENLAFLHVRNCIFDYCLPPPEFSWCSFAAKMSDFSPLDLISKDESLYCWNLTVTVFSLYLEDACQWWQENKSPLSPLFTEKTEWSHTMQETISVYLTSVGFKLHQKKINFQASWDWDLPTASGISLKNHLSFVWGISTITLEKLYWIMGSA